MTKAKSWHGRASRSAILKAHARHWTEWMQVPIKPEMREKYPHLRHCSAIYTNSRYEVQTFHVPTSIGGVWQMTAMRHGNLERITWEELQRIKNELFTPEAMAVEIYPAIKDEWNGLVRVLWILPTTYSLPFGIHMPGAWGIPVGGDKGDDEQKQD